MKCGESTGRTTKRGSLCGCEMHGGKCPVHDSNLSERNRKVAIAAAQSEERRKQLSEAGKKGWKAALATGRDYHQMIQRLAKSMKDRPSKPEIWLNEQLERMGLEYDTQGVIAGNERSYIVDVVGSGWAIEIDGWRTYDKPFGRTDQSHAIADLNQKLDYLRRNGYRTLYLNARDGESANREKLRDFFSWV